MTLSEVMVSALLTTTISGAAFSLVAPVRGLVQAQPEAADIHQRIRVAVETLTGAVREADDVFPDAAGGLDVVVGGETSRYFLDTADGTLRRSRGGSDLPVVDHIVGFAVEYFDDPGGRVRRVRITLRAEAAPPSLRGRAGPAFVNAGTSTSAERYLPDQEVAFDVALRRP